MGTDVVVDELEGVLERGRGEPILLIAALATATCAMVVGFLLFFSSVFQICAAVCKCIRPATPAAAKTSRRRAPDTVVDDEDEDDDDDEDGGDKESEGGPPRP